MRFVLRTLLAPLAATIGLMTLASAQAIDWPTKPVRAIVPYPAGGNADGVARLVADKLGAALGQPVVIDNKGGAGATIGTELAARSAPDGYTFLISPNAVFTITPHLRKVNYDPFGDFIPVAALSGSYSIVTARKDAPFSDIAGLLAAARKEPGKYTFGSAGPATATQISGEMVKAKAGIDLMHVPYKGSAESLSDLLGGRIDLIFDPVGLSQIKAGNLKALAVFSKTRHPELPHVPTLQEQGVDVDSRGWFGLFVPKGTPQPIVDKTAKALEKIMAAPEVREALLKMSQYPEYVGPAPFAKMVREDSAFFKDLIITANIRVE